MSVNELFIKLLKSVSLTTSFLWSQKNNFNMYLLEQIALVSSRLGKAKHNNYYWRPCRLQLRFFQKKFISFIQLPIKNLILVQKKTNLKTHFCFSWQFFWTGFAKSCQCFHETSTIKFSLFHLKFARFFLSNFQWLVISMSQIHPLRNFQLCFRYQKSESPNFPKTVQKFR